MADGLKYRFYQVDLRRFVISEQWSLKAGCLFIQVVSNTGFTVLYKCISTNDFLSLNLFSFALFLTMFDF